MTLVWRCAAYDIDAACSSTRLPGTAVTVWAPSDETVGGAFDPELWIADFCLPSSAAFIEARAATPQEALDKLADLLPAGTFTSAGGSA